LRDGDKGFGDCREFLVIAHEAAVLDDPSEGPFHHPPAANDGKSNAALHDLQDDMGAGLSPAQEPTCITAVHVSTFSRTPVRLSLGDQRRNERPLGVREIGRVGAPTHSLPCHGCRFQIKPTPHESRPSRLGNPPLKHALRVARNESIVIGHLDEVEHISSVLDQRTDASSERRRSLAIVIDFVFGYPIDLRTGRNPRQWLIVFIFSMG
jgi:hypothetical protein